jgi:hypothetical protein
MFPKSQSALGYITKFGHGATGWLALPVSGGGVTSFPGRLRDGLPLGRDPQGGLALTGNGDVFDATGMAAISANGGNRAGYFVGIHPPVSRCFREIARLAIGMGGMGATFVPLARHWSTPYPSAWLATMNTRLSANAAEPARSEKQAKSAEMDRMRAPVDEGPAPTGNLKVVNND